MTAKFKELALFRFSCHIALLSHISISDDVHRRAIKVAEIAGTVTSVEFAKQMGTYRTKRSSKSLLTSIHSGGEVGLARRLFKRLEVEGTSRFPLSLLCDGDRLRAIEFILEVTTTIDDIGFVQTRSKSKPKGKGKASKPRRAPQRKYVFSRKSKSTQAYLDYFSPDLEVETCLLGVPQSVGISSRHLVTALIPALDPESKLRRSQANHNHDAPVTQSCFCLTLFSSNGYPNPR